MSWTLTQENRPLVSSARLQSLFTPRVVAVILLLVAFTMTPTIMQLIITGPGSSPGQLLAFLPRVLFYLSFIPSVVIGTVLLYIMCTQVAAGLGTAFDALQELGKPRFDNLLVLGLPILAGVIVAFLPPSVTATFPTTLQPVLGNGFVVGIVLALLLEHVVFRK